MYNYLKPKEYYEDLYDKFTVKRCLDHERFFLKQQIDPNDKDAKEKERVLNAALGVSLYFIKGYRYKEKESTIQEWMNRDKEIDRRLEEAILYNVKCPFCHSANMSLESKDVLEERVLFLYKCDDCKKISSFNEYGERKTFESRCPKCNDILEGKAKREKDKITSYYKCPSCNYKEKPEVYLFKNKKEEDNSWKKYREICCFSEIKGREFIDGEIRLKGMRDLVDEIKTMDANKGLYERLDKLEKLNIAKLKELLNKSLVKNKYTQLKFSEPEIGKDVIVSFKVQDNDAVREEYESKDELKKTINETLKNTNWRLMSDGVNYRLGFLSGRLRGYENKDDLLKLVK